MKKQDKPIRPATTLMRGCGHWDNNTVFMKITKNDVEAGRPIEPTPLGPDHPRRNVIVNIDDLSEEEIESVRLPCSPCLGMTVLVMQDVPTKAGRELARTHYGATFASGFSKRSDEKRIPNPHRRALAYAYRELGFRPDLAPLWCAVGPLGLFAMPIALAVIMI